MKRVFFILLSIFFVLSFWSSVSMSEMTTTIKLKQMYSDYIDKFISTCTSKAERRNSKLLNIRREAALYALKAHFFRNYKDELTKNMIAENIGTKEHRIHYYLNKRFFNMLETALASLHHVRSGEDAMFGG